MLNKWRPKKNHFRFFKKILSKKNKVLLYTPDPLKKAGGIKKFGIDEFTVLKKLTKVLNVCNQKILILIKLHPNHNYNSFVRELKKIDLSNNIKIKVLNKFADLYLNELLISVNLVIGIISNIILEAEILGAKTIRIIDGLSIPDPLAGVSKALIWNYDLISLQKLLISRK